MKTLVIHPEDRSTDFLTPIYAGKGFDVLKASREDLRHTIPDYDRVIMLGHGSPNGLFSLGKFPGAMAIDPEHRLALSNKDNVYIWCNASTFVVRMGLTGYTSGMFISEVSEALWFGIRATQAQINRSNDLFAEVLGECLDLPDRMARVRALYNDPNCQVINYNRNLLCQVSK
jgi:hypothetical protein